MLEAHPFPHLAGFYAAWTASLVAVETRGDAPRHIGEAIMLDLGGFAFPVITAVAAVAGVLISRPLSPRREPPLGLFKNILVTLIMVAIALFWVIDDQPRVLFAFLVSIGLGFSGYSLIELAGEELSNFVKRIFSLATGTIGNGGKNGESR